MKPLAFLAALLALAAIGSAAPPAKPPPAQFEPIDIKMSVVEGDVAAGRDSRVFAVPVECSGVKSAFTWACGGETILSETFARKASLTTKPDPENAGFLDAQGNAIFLGSTLADLLIGGRSHITRCWVMRDADYNKGMTGILGYSVARQYQWEVDPRIPQLTLRPLNTKPAKKPLLTLPIKDENSNIWLNVKIRNVAVDVALIPQTTDLQAGPDLQKKWDLEHKGEKLDIKTYLGAVRTATLTGKSGVYLSPAFLESDVTVILLDDNPNAKSGVGQSLLNRWLYTVDAQRKEFWIAERIEPKKDSAVKP